MTSIPVSRTEFMKLISRIEQLEAEVSLLRNYLAKAPQSSDNGSIGKLSQFSDSKDSESDSETVTEVSVSSSKSHKRLLTTKKPSTNIHFQ